MFSISENEKVKVKEYAPNIFREIRKSLVDDELFLDSLKPSQNFNAIHNFKLGSGKSPSFFFFSDNKQLMIKTVKPSEMDILFKTDFLTDYLQHLKDNPDSLLSRILGVFEVTVSKSSPMVFLITENMLGEDCHAIKRCYDLKGSLHQRITKVTEEQKITGSGLMVLKD